MNTRHFSRDKIIRGKKETIIIWDVVPILEDHLSSLFLVISSLLLLTFLEQHLWKKEEELFALNIVSVKKLQNTMAIFSLSFIKALKLFPLALNEEIKRVIVVAEYLHLLLCSYFS